MSVWLVHFVFLKEESYVCREEGRVLSDAELLLKVFEYEANERDLTEPFLSLGLNGLMEANPSCCSVMRSGDQDGFMDTTPRGPLTRLLFEPYFYLQIYWSSDPGKNHRTDRIYTADLCGRIG